MPAARLLGCADLPCSKTAPAQARSYVRTLLNGVVHDDLELLTSELVTNAYQHASGPTSGRVTLALLEIGDVLRLEVIDEGGPGEPQVFDDPDSLSGRGMLLVDRLSIRWGSWRDAAGRTTWCETRAELQPTQPASRLTHEEI